jgi:F-box and WD-40 domain protein 1/11
VLHFLTRHMTSTSLNTQHDSLRFSSPPSPSPSLDYSFVSPPSPGPDRDPALYASHSGRSQPYLCLAQSASSSSRDKRCCNTLHGTTSSYRAAGGNRAPQTGKSMKLLLPRIWGALSSPTRKARRQTARRKPYALPSNVSYADLQPLDGEEGELIDEACYIDRYDAPQSPRKLIGPRFHSFCPLRVSETIRFARLRIVPPD